MSLLDKRIGRVIKFARIEANMTQLELGVGCGWPRNVIANLECGRKPVRIADLLTIAKQLHVPVERLVARILSDEPLV